jgi:hypothetical protein
MIEKFNDGGEQKGSMQWFWALSNPLILDP